MEILNTKLKNEISRRSFLKSTATTLLAGAVFLPAAGGCDDNSPRDLRFANLNDALAELNALEAAGGVEMYQPFSLFQVLTHTAQSVEYGMSGFPEEKSKVYQETIGKVAFNTFKGQGFMSHELGDPVPSAPDIPTTGDLTAGLARLRNAIYAFQGHTGPIFPHFAYGQLSKSDFDLANSMHIADHFSALLYT